AIVVALAPLVGVVVGDCSVLLVGSLGLRRIRTALGCGFAADSPACLRDLNAPMSGAHDAQLPVRQCTSQDGWRFSGCVPMAQAVQHADEHRSQVLSMLGARGLHVPDLGVWDYAESVRVMHLEDTP